MTGVQTCALPISDTIQGFASGTDKIVLDDAVYAGLGTVGDFAANDERFYLAAGATAGFDPEDRIVYDTASGKLWYDADGLGGSAASLIATLAGNPTLAATDILVF